MFKFLVVASAVMAGIVLTPQAWAPQARAAPGSDPAGQVSGHTGSPPARAAARNLRRHGFWGFGKARMGGGYLFLQAYRGRGVPVMVKIAIDSGRVVAVKTFQRRHVRSGIALAGQRPISR